VGDVDDAGAFSLELQNDLEELLDLSAGQCGRRLIEDAYLGLDGERFGDFHHLLLGDAEPAHYCPGVDVDLQAVQQGPCLRSHPSPIQDRYDLAPLELATQKDVLRHAEKRNEVELLVDCGDAEGLRVPRAVDLDGLIVDRDLTPVLPIGTGHNLDQRRFSGPVLAHQNVDFPSIQVEVHSVEGHHPGERLDDALELEYRHRLRARAILSS
jgi:hypothetical protein